MLKPLKKKVPVRTLVNTATLVRGRVYTLKAICDGGIHPFERGKPQVVSDDLADELDEVADEVQDSEGEVIVKKLFRVSRNVRAPGDEMRSAARLRPVRERVPEEDTADETFDDDTPRIRRRHRRPMRAGV